MVVKPDVAGLLPVFVLDRYAGYEVKLLQDCTRGELDHWVEANAAAYGGRATAAGTVRTGTPLALDLQHVRGGDDQGFACHLRQFRKLAE